MLSCSTWIGLTADHKGAAALDICQEASVSIDELTEAASEIFQVICLYTGNDSDFGIVAQKRTVTLIGLGHYMPAPAPAGVDAVILHFPASQYRRLQPEGTENLGDHPGDGSLSMGLLQLCRHGY